MMNDEVKTSYGIVRGVPFQANVMWHSPCPPPKDVTGRVCGSCPGRPGANGWPAGGRGGGDSGQRRGASFSLFHESQDRKRY